MEEEKAGDKAGGRITVESRPFGSEFNEYSFHVSTTDLQIFVKTMF